jgi:hypothetical protein
MVWWDLVETRTDRQFRKGPKYMLRLKVSRRNRMGANSRLAGASIEKRIEHDMYYIENGLFGLILGPRSAWCAALSIRMPIDPAFRLRHTAANQGIVAVSTASRFCYDRILLCPKSPQREACGKPWGYELIWAHTDRYVGKVLHIRRRVSQLSVPSSQG